MTVPSIGWLPYGSDDESVLFAHDLKSQIVAGDISGKWSTLTLVGSGLAPTHDAERGMLARDVNGADAAYKFATQAAAMDVLDGEGQLLIEVEKEQVGSYYPSLGSYGDDGRAGNQCVISGQASAASGSNLLLVWYTNFATTPDSYQMRFPGSATPLSLDYHEHTPSGVSVGTSWPVSTYKKDTYVKLQLAWRRGLVYFAIDDLVYSYGIMDTSTTSKVFNSLWIGSYVNSANTYVARYLRNFQIASKAPTFLHNNVLSQIAFLSDSLIDNKNYAQVTSVDAIDNVIHAVISRGLAHMGIRAKIDISENPGYTISTLGTQLETKAQTVINFSPSVVIVCGGTNDFTNGGYVSADFLAEYKDLIEQLFFGTAKTSRTTVKYVMPMYPPPRRQSDGTAYSAAILANFDDVRTQIASLPAWWDATYGATYGNGRVVDSIDLFTLFGSSHNWASPDTYDYTHLFYAGTYKVGQEIFKRLLELENL